ncbi:STY4534 family ICE replication protein [Stutzerimonas stutzeri]|uniref:STY4534 family ICE replication protein n=1 Tax=Stutzerimonas stutzeri TaxID=316 RepID=A0AA42PCV3_STUST|nr:STY4534 family ICE replication protein [Stutzerimonas stutzeri]MDH1237925.1 STY4534 family ICE replication protein [Stutzerimonas stutzeri]
MTTSSEKSYFDLHITGLGYLNRIREVKPKKGDAFLACDIAALNGPSDQPEYRRFDVRVSGSEAQHLIRRCVPAVEAERKVLIGFRLGDLWTDIFTYSKGKRVGEQSVSLKARLLFVSWIKVDGQLVYKAEPKASEETARDEAPSVSSEPAAQDAPASEAVSDDEVAEVPALAESF